MKAEELEKEERLNKSHDNGLTPSGISELLCEHKGSGKPPFAHGLCESCYTDVNSNSLHIYFLLFRFRC